jgi:predicted TPR repeat methyltransferase
MDAKERVEWIYQTKNNDQLSVRYDEWAKNYENDLCTAFNWIGPERVAEVFAAHVAKDARVLDIGAGTGMVGVLLAKQGFSDLAANDLSQGMLDEACRKNVYRELRIMVLGEHLGYEDDAFDAGVACGVFTVGHAPASSFDELLRIIRPGGLLIFSMQTIAYETAGFKEKFDELEADGKWVKVDVSDKFQPLPKGEPNVWHRIWVCRVV